MAKFKIYFNEDDALVEQEIEAETKLEAMEQFFEIEDIHIEEIKK